MNRIIAIGSLRTRVNPVSLQSSLTFSNFARYRLYHHSEEERLHPSRWRLPRTEMLVNLISEPKLHIIKRPSLQSRMLKYSRANNVDKVLELYNSIENRNIPEREHLISISISTLARNRNWKLMEHILSTSISKKSLSNKGIENIYTAAVCGYLKADEDKQAQQLISKMKANKIRINKKIYLEWVRMYKRSSDISSALSLYHDIEVQQRNEQSSSQHYPLLLTTSLFNSFIEVFSKGRDSYNAFLLLLKVRSPHFVPNGNTFTPLIQNAQNTEEIDKIYGYMMATRFSYKISTWTALICSMIRCNDISMATTSIHEMPFGKRDLNFWNAVLLSICEKDETQAARSLMFKMKQYSFKPSNHVLMKMMEAISRKKEPIVLETFWDTAKQEYCKNPSRKLFHTVMTTASNVKNKDMLQSAFQDMIKVGIVPKRSDYLTLLHCFAKMGDMHNSALVLKAMRENNLDITDDATIAGIIRSIQSFDQVQIALQFLRTKVNQSNETNEKSLSEGVLWPLLKMCSRSLASIGKDISNSNASLQQTVLKSLENLTKEKSVQNEKLNIDAIHELITTIRGASLKH